MGLFTVQFWFLIMNIYRISEQEKEQLEMCNGNNIFWIPTADENGFYNTEKCLNNPHFSNHKEVFDSFPSRSVENKSIPEQIGP